MIGAGLTIAPLLLDAEVLPMSLYKETLRKSRSTPSTTVESTAEAQAWRELALDSLMSGEPASGLWYLRNAIDLDADDPETWQLMGRCFEEMGEEARARKCFLLALRQHALSGADGNPHPSTQLSLHWRRKPSRDA